MMRDRSKHNVHWIERYNRRPETMMINGVPVLADDRDSKEFKTYIQLIEDILREANGSLLTIREIKSRLGERLHERWLLDALAYSSHILHVPAYVDRFAYVRSDSSRKSPKPAKEDEFK